jgi:hypothetical protein
MAAIITDQLRISRAKQFVDSATNNSYYSFIGLTDPETINSNWDQSPVAPIDSFNEENKIWESIVALKKIYPEDVRQVIRKISWESGIIYDMYRHDISRNRPSRPSGAISLYSANYYVVNKNYQIYICLSNGRNPNNPNGVSSQIEPEFTDIEPRTLSDGYIWKYLYSLSAEEILKFDSTNFVPVPKNWGEDGQSEIIKTNAINGGQLKIAVITNRGNFSAVPGVRNRVFNNIPIKGDGTGAVASIVLNNNSQVESVFITNGGQGYTFAQLDLAAGGVPSTLTPPTFDVIIAPSGGHGFNIYRELGAYYVSFYSRLENDEENPDFIVGNKIARFGVIENPEKFNSIEILDDDKASSLNALKLVGITNPLDYQSAVFLPNSNITQTIGVAQTAIGKVISYDNRTGVIKYTQNREFYGVNVSDSQNSPEFSLNVIPFSPGGDLVISGGNINLKIDVNFGTIENVAISTTINNRTYNLGQSFIEGISNPEVKNYSGNIIYVDNRPPITRSQNQKEDIKVIIQF